MSNSPKDDLAHIRAQAPFNYNTAFGQKVCGVNAKIGGPNPIMDIRGWGYLTGGGHGALGLSVEQAKAEQDALGDLVADLLNKHFEAKVLEAEMLKESCHDAPCDEQPSEPITKMPHQTPSAEGHYWAKLVHPHGMPEGEDWASVDYEIVQVSDNNGEGDDKWRVYVAGIEQGQLLDGFIWGPRVPDFGVKPEPEQSDFKTSKPRHDFGWYWMESEEGVCHGPFETRDAALEDLWADGTGQTAYRELIADEGEEFAGTKEDFLNNWEWVGHMGRGPIRTDIFWADYELEQFEDINEDFVWGESPPDWPDDAKRELEMMLADALFRWAEKHDLWKQFRGLT